MTLPPDPTLFLAHCKAHKTPTQSQPCKELKMPTHNPPTPADEYLSSLAMLFSIISILNTKPTHNSTDENIMKIISNISKSIAINISDYKHKYRHKKQQNIFFYIFNTIFCIM